MAARTFASLLLMFAIMASGCAGTANPLSNAASTTENSAAVYRYQPLKGSASQAWSAAHRKSMTSLNQAIQKDRSNPVAFVRRGALHAQSAEFDKADQDFEQAFDLLQMQPKSGSRPAILAELHMQRALLKRERNDREGALADLTISVDLAPEYWEPRFHRWQLFREMGKTSEANADREAGMKLSPKVFSQTYDSHRGII